jgi:hypothetical protein
MKQKKTFLAFTTGFFLTLLLSPLAQARLEITASELLLKNSEQFSDIVRRKIKKAQDIQAKQEVEVNEKGEIFAEPEAVSGLRDAMRIVLSRPDQDGARSKLFNKVRQELNDLHSLDSSLTDIVNESCAGLKSKDINLKYEETYLVILDNFLSEVRPEVETNETFKTLVAKVRDSDIHASEKMKGPNRSIAVNANISKSAAEILPKSKK